MDVIEKDLVGVAKRQRVSVKKSCDAIDGLVAALRAAQAGAAGAPHADAVAAAAASALAAVKEEHRVLHGGISKLGKAVDKLQLPELDCVVPFFECEWSPCWQCSLSRLQACLVVPPILIYIAVQPERRRWACWGAS